MLTAAAVDELRSHASDAEQTKIRGRYASDAPVIGARGKGLCVMPAQSGDP